MVEAEHIYERTVSELVTFRAAEEDVTELRIICQATGISMAEEIRSGIRLRLGVLLANPDVQQAVVERKAELEALYSNISAPVIREKRQF